MPAADWLPPQLLIFLLWFASLFVPLFLIPEALLRLGFREWWARLIGWLFYMVLLAAVVGTGTIELSGGVASLWPVLAAVITFAILWDIRKARRREATQGEGR